MTESGGRQARRRREWVSRGELGRPRSHTLDAILVDVLQQSYRYRVVLPKTERLLAADLDWMPGHLRERQAAKADQASGGPYQQWSRHGRIGSPGFVPR